MTVFDEVFKSSQAERQERSYQVISLTPIYEERELNLGDYITVIKTVSSGLSTRGNGCGTNRKTVVHAMMTRDLKSGKLKRMPGYLLCGTNFGSFGISDVFDRIKNPDCPKCKEMVKRYRLTPANRIIVLEEDALATNP